MDPSGVAAIDEVDLRMLSRAELAAYLWEAKPVEDELQRVLVEFRRRFWNRQWEISEAGVTCSIPPGP